MSFANRPANSIRAPAVRVLCLGNDLLADDGAGPEVARQLRRTLPNLNVVATAESGLYLLDYIQGCDRLIVIDSIASAGAEPGTVHQLGEADLQTAPGDSPHYVGLLDTLAIGRNLGMRMPDTVVVLAVEAEDLTTVGGPMTAAVRQCLPHVIESVQELAVRTSDMASLSPRVLP